MKDATPTPADQVLATVFAYTEYKGTTYEVRAEMRADGTVRHAHRNTDNRRWRAPVIYGHSPVVARGEGRPHAILRGNLVELGWKLR